MVVKRHVLLGWPIVHGAMLVSWRVSMCNYGWTRCVTRAATKATDHLSIQPSPSSKTKRFSGMLFTENLTNLGRITLPNFHNETWTWNAGKPLQRWYFTKHKKASQKRSDFSILACSLEGEHMFPPKKQCGFSHPKHKSKASFAVSPFKEEDETNQRSLRCEQVVWYHSQMNPRFSLNMNYLIQYLHTLIATLQH